MSFEAKRQSRRSGWRTSSLSPAAPEEKGGEMFKKNAMKNMFGFFTHIADDDLRIQFWIDLWNWGV